MTVAAVALGGVVAVAAACGTGTSADPDDDGAADASGCSNGLWGDSVPQASDPGLKRTHNGFKDQASQYGSEVALTDANLDVNKQISDVTTLLQRNITGLSIWPMDSTAIKPAIDRAKAAGIPVVSQNTLTKIGVDTNLQFDNYGGGAAMARYLFDKLGAGADVASVAGPTEVEQFRDLAKGFQEEAERLGLDVVAVKQNPGLSPTVSASIGQELRTRYGSELGGIFDTLNVTALALATANQGDFDPLIVTYSGNEETYQAISDGRITATLYEPGVIEGRAKAWALCELIKGETLPEDIYVPQTVIDKENVDVMPSDDEQMAAELEFSIAEEDGRMNLIADGVELPESAVRLGASDQ